MALFKEAEIDPRLAAALWGGGLGLATGGVSSLGSPTSMLRGGLIGAGVGAGATHIAQMPEEERKALWRSVQGHANSLWDKAHGLASGGQQPERGQELEALAQGRAGMGKSGNLIGTAAPKAVDLARELFT